MVPMLVVPWILATIELTPLWFVRIDRLRVLAQFSNNSTAVDIT